MAEAKEAVTYTDKSAFHGLGLPDADDLVLRADLLGKIAEIIKARRLTQAKAAELMGMDQPRVSALLNGKISKFSTDRLLTALSDLGQDVELKITPSKRAKGRLRIAA
ncbi:MAG: helix-turn-helix transcriptional regulator [Rhodospirillales bacterium]|jgi:predicted XRE-type DNA-binding protein